MSLWVKSYSVAIHMKATKQSFPVVWCIMLHKEVLTVESVGEMLKCYYSNESYWIWVLPYTFVNIKAKVPLIKTKKS